ncbi:MAG: tRNA pseudouridine(55) synthase TruB [Proteobacteria bacterium]|nr:tRNA pseudouridine(55) synthase TruB [Pseudomonadota bacterium]
MVNLNGWLLVNKPEGLSSAAALNHIKKYIKPSKIGHSGTLDPFATGILLVGVGEATKLMPYLIEADKGYEFVVRWGEHRDTLDITGELVATSARIPTQAEVESVLPRFLGQTQQEPPQFSAIKINGRRAYYFARTGKIVQLDTRPVRIDKLELMGHGEGFSAFRVQCSKGTYVRALARDIAHALGAYCHVIELSRTRLGKFVLKDAITLASLAEILHNDGASGLGDLLMPVERVLDDILVHDVGEYAARLLRHGRAVIAEAIQPGDGALVAAMCDGALVAICRFESGGLQPIKVLNL